MRDPVAWLVLDNLKNHWPYHTNICDHDKADAAYRRCVKSGLIRDGIITEEGKVWLLVNR